MPAYNASSWFAVFFIIYILINTYIFMSVFLAVVYNNYKKHLKVPPPPPLVLPPPPPCPPQVQLSNLLIPQ